MFYLGVLFISFQQVNRIRKLTRGRPEFEQIHNIAYCMFLSLISYAITSFFATVGYGFYLPALAGISSVFYVAAMKEISGRGGGVQAPSFGPMMAPSRIQMSAKPAWNPALQSASNGARPRG